MRWPPPTQSAESRGLVCGWRGGWHSSLGDPPSLGWWLGEGGFAEVASTRAATTCENALRAARTWLAHADGPSVTESGPASPLVALFSAAGRASLVFLFFTLQDAHRARPVLQEDSLGPTSWLWRTDRAVAYVVFPPRIPVPLLVDTQAPSCVRCTTLARRPPTHASVRPRRARARPPSGARTRAPVWVGG